MALAVIGSGFGRTGTRSLKDALETLGFGPCHHMEEVFMHPEQVMYWQAVAMGQKVDWNQVFAGYRSQVDWPGAGVWKELSRAFPDAKVIHTIRPEEEWWASFSATIGKLLRTYQGLPVPPHIRAMLDAMGVVVGQRTFGGPPDHDTAIAAFRTRTEEVRAAIPPERLLVYDPAEGWEPLCRFLDVAVPATPFPNRNQLLEFWARLGGEPV